MHVTYRGRGTSTTWVGSDGILAFRAASMASSAMAMSNQLMRAEGEAMFVSSAGERELFRPGEGCFQSCKMTSNREKILLIVPCNPGLNYLPNLDTCLIGKDAGLFIALGLLIATDTHAFSHDVIPGSFHLATARISKNAPVPSRPVRETGVQFGLSPYPQYGAAAAQCLACSFSEKKF